MSTKSQVQAKLDTLPDDDRPLFLLEPQDGAAPSTIDYWCETVSALGAPLEKVQEAESCATAMEQWQAEHGSKIPD